MDHRLRQIASRLCVEEQRRKDDIVSLASMAADDNTDLTDLVKRLEQALQAAWDRGVEFGKAGH